jgi:hypothetical protein
VCSKGANSPQAVDPLALHTRFPPRTFAPLGFSSLGWKPVRLFRLRLDHPGPGNTGTWPPTGLAICGPALEIGFAGRGHPALAAPEGLVHRLDPVVFAQPGLAPEIQFPAICLSVCLVFQPRRSAIYLLSFKLTVLPYSN